MVGMKVKLPGIGSCLETTPNYCFARSTNAIAGIGL